MNSTDLWIRVAQVAEIVEGDEERRASIRLAAEHFLRAIERMAEGDLDGFLSRVALAGDFAERTRFGQYNERLPDGDVPMPKGIELRAGLIRVVN